MLTLEPEWLDRIGQGILAAGSAVAAAGFLWLLVKAFGKNLWWGIGSLLFPFVILVFAASHWSETRRALLVWLLGVVIMSLGIVVLKTSVLAPPPPP